MPADDPLPPVLRVPGTGSLEPSIQETCHLLEDRLTRPDSRFEHPADWHRLLQVAGLHASALDRVDPRERREFASCARLASGWWGDGQKATDAGLERTLIRNALTSAELPEAATEVKRRLRGPGVFALRHRRLAPFVHIGREPHQLIEALRRLLSLAFDGASGVDEATAVAAAALLLTRQTDWRLTLITAESEQERLALQNELALRHCALWPRGLNAGLNQTLACLKELRELRWRSGGDRSHLAEGGGDGSLTARRLGLADLQFEDLRRLVFEADESGLYRCDEETRELSRLARQLRSRGEEFHQVDFDVCHRLHAMASSLAGKPRPADRLKYRREVREHSGWWGRTADWGGAAAFSGDSIANLDCLARTLAEKLGQSDGGHYETLQTPGVFVLRHRSRPCWRYVSRPSDDVLTELRSLLHRSLDGFPSDGCPRGGAAVDDLGGGGCVASALLLLSAADEWRFELHPEPDRLAMAELYNRLVLRLDTLWPGGANLALVVDWETLPALQESLGEAHGD